MQTTNIPLVPKDPSVEFIVLAIGRISTVHQDVENIEASYRYVQDYLQKIYGGPMNIRLLGEQASGMLTDRATIREAESLVAGGKIDLVIAEDLARIYRNPRYQYDFVQNAVDTRTRVICIGDNLDTADENWEITMGAASLRHGPAYSRYSPPRPPYRHARLPQGRNGSKGQVRLPKTIGQGSRIRFVRPDGLENRQTPRMHAHTPPDGPSIVCRRVLYRDRRLAQRRRHRARPLRRKRPLDCPCCRRPTKRSDFGRDQDVSRYDLPTAFSHWGT